MSKKHWVDKDHYRVVSADGRRSWLYRADGAIFSSDTCVEVADHGSDGTTTAYEYDGSVLAELLNGGRGRKK